MLVEERSSYWINLHDLLHCMDVGWKPLSLSTSTNASSIPSTTSTSDDSDNSFYFIWGSERSGFRQLYLYHYDR